MAADGHEGFQMAVGNLFGVVLAWGTSNLPNSIGLAEPVHQPKLA